MYKVGNCYIISNKLLWLCGWHRPYAAITTKPYRYGLLGWLVVEGRTHFEIRHCCLRRLPITLLPNLGYSSWQRCAMECIHFWPKLCHNLRILLCNVYSNRYQNKQSFVIVKVSTGLRISNFDLSKVPFKGFKSVHINTIFP